MSAGASGPLLMLLLLWVVSEIPLFIQFLGSKNHLKHNFFRETVLIQQGPASPYVLSQQPITFLITFIINYNHVLSA